MRLLFFLVMLHSISLYSCSSITGHLAKNISKKDIEFCLEKATQDNATSDKIIWQQVSNYVKARNVSCVSATRLPINLNNSITSELYSSLVVKKDQNNTELDCEKSQNLLAAYTLSAIGNNWLSDYIILKEVKRLDNATSNDQTTECWSLSEKQLQRI